MNLLKSMAKKSKSVPKLIRELWKIVSPYIRERDKGICITCGKVGGQAGHYIHSTERGGSKRLPLYWYVKNINCQCQNCNYNDGEHHRYAIALQKKYGPSILEELEGMRKKVGEAKLLVREDYEKLIREYSKKLIE